MFSCVLHNYYRKGWIRDSTVDDPASTTHEIIAPEQKKLTELLHDKSTIQFSDGTFLLKEEFECRQPFGLYRPYEGYILISAGSVRMFEECASKQCKDGCFCLSTRTEGVAVALVLELKSVQRGIDAYFSTPTVWGDCPTDLCGPSPIKFEVKDILMDVRNGAFCCQEGKDSIRALRMNVVGF